MRSAADLPERLRAGEDRLVAEGKAQPTRADIGSPTDQPGDLASIVDIKRKGPGGNVGSRELLANSVDEISGQRGVRMKKEKILSTRDAGAEIDLRTATFLTSEYGKTQVADDRCGVVLAFPVDDDDFDVWLPQQRSDGLRDRL